MTVSFGTADISYDTKILERTFGMIWFRSDSLGPPEFVPDDVSAVGFASLIHIGGK